MRPPLALHPHSIVPCVLTNNPVHNTTITKPFGVRNFILLNYCVCLLRPKPDRYTRKTMIPSHTHLVSCVIHSVHVPWCTGWWFGTL